MATLPDRTTPPATALTQTINRLRSQRAESIRRHEAELKDIDAAIRQSERERAFVLGGMQLQQVRLAETVLYVEGAQNRNRGSGASVITDAIDDLAAGAKKLRRWYLGTKVYDRWDGQRDDGAYGTGPRHGTTIFAIGLKQEARDRDLDPDEIEAAIRYLLTLKGGAEWPST